MRPQSKKSYVFKSIAILVISAFLQTSIAPVSFAQQINVLPFSLPKPGVMIHLSPEFTPAILKGLVIHPENALKFDFIVLKGDKEFTDTQKKEEYTKLIKYFLASLAVPDENQWVNLSPYEKDRIIKDDFGKTEMGRDILAEDYLLKQITASMIYPEDNLGKKFWDKVYAQAQEQYGTTNVPVNTFNKVWIVPDSAEIYEKGNAVFLINSHLKVMMEEDYLSLQKHSGIQSAPKENQAHSVASKIVKEIVLPQLEIEVNEGKNFASLRQAYSGMILAAWYKRALKESLLGKIYANRSMVKGVDQDPKNNEAIYRQYLMAYKKGVFNFIKEDVDKFTNESIPRKYFSGGVAPMNFNAIEHKDTPAVGEPAMVSILQNSDTDDLTWQGQEVNAAMTTFKIGGSNSNRTIAQLNELAGVPITEIEQRAIKHSSAEEKFLAENERFLDILQTDNTFVTSNGFTHQQLAQPLLEAVKVEHGLFTFNGKTYKVEWLGIRGFVDSIFNDKQSSSSFFRVSNPRTKVSTGWFPGLMPEYISQFGFYGGHVINRIEPKDIMRIFFTGRKIVETAPVNSVKKAANGLGQAKNIVPSNMVAFAKETPRYRRLIKEILENLIKDLKEESSHVLVMAPGGQRYYVTNLRSVYYNEIFLDLQHMFSATYNKFGLYRNRSFLHPIGDHLFVLGVPLVDYSTSEKAINEATKNLLNQMEFDLNEINQLDHAMTGQTKHVVLPNESFISASILLPGTKVSVQEGLLDMVFRSPRSLVELQRYLRDIISLPSDIAKRQLAGNIKELQGKGASNYLYFDDGLSLRPQKREAAEIDLKVIQVAMALTEDERLNFINYVENFTAASVGKAKPVEVRSYPGYQISYLTQDAVDQLKTLGPGSVINVVWRDGEYGERFTVKYSDLLDQDGIRKHNSITFMERKIDVAFKNWMKNTKQGQKYAADQQAREKAEAARIKRISTGLGLLDLGDSTDSGKVNLYGAVNNIDFNEDLRDFKANLASMVKNFNNPQVLNSSIAYGKSLMGNLTPSEVSVINGKGYKVDFYSKYSPFFALLVVRAIQEAKTPQAKKAIIDYVNTFDEAMSPKSATTENWLKRNKVKVIDKFDLNPVPLTVQEFAEELVWEYRKNNRKTIGGEWNGSWLLTSPAAMYDDISVAASRLVREWENRFRNDIFSTPDSLTLDEFAAKLLEERQIRGVKEIRGEIWGIIVMANEKTKKSDFIRAYSQAYVKKYPAVAKVADSHQDLASLTKGGIDFNAVNLNMNIKRDGNGVPLPINKQDWENIHIDGLRPIILDIKPAISSPLLEQLQNTGAR